MKKQILAILFLAAILSLPTLVCSQEDEEEAEEPAIDVSIDTMGIDQLNLIKGELETLKVHNLNRLSLTDPDVADIIDATETEVLLIGQQLGQTILFIWDDHGKRDIVINVIARDLTSVKERLSTLLKAADIPGPVLDVNDMEGKVVVSGQVPEKNRIQFDKLMLTFDDDVVDVTKEEEVEDLIQVDLQISELNATFTKNLGIDWSTGGGGEDGGEDTEAGGELNPIYDENLPNFDGSIGDFFKIGDFARTNALKASVQALLAEGKGKILSQPKLVVVSGREASFLVGGEIPIRTTTSTDSGGTQENVQFKEYGISMTVTPTVQKNGKIDVIMGVEVSDVDASTPITGDSVAFITREADTRLIVDDGQTIIMAGLIRESKSEVIKKVPFLGDIPIMGLVFRSKTMPTPETNTELVIMMTPHLMRATKVAKKEEQPAQRIIDGQGTIAKYTSGVKPYYSGIPHEMRDYVRSIQDKISQSIKYPREAIQYGWEGTVKVNMLILQDGTLAFALVRESSGYDVIDENALEMAKLSAPYSSFPTDTKLQELNVTIPIVYSLNSN